MSVFRMKLATGGSLRTAGATLRDEPREAVRLMTKVTRAVQYAHGRGIHRDLQPGNILLDDRDEPMVSDFGLAKWLGEESNLTRTLTSFGTPGYIAPEQAGGASFGSAADIYSLGAIFFTLLLRRDVRDSRARARKRGGQIRSLGLARLRVCPRVRR
jgi:eukaryotic-like serine/threonine-protein kinase